MTIWNQRFSSDEYIFGTEPNDFLKEFAERLPRNSRVLCIGEGEGRNAIYLAKLGHNVTALDSSDVGLKKAQNLAQKQSVKLETIHADLAHFQWGNEEWDAVVSIFCHLPSAVRAQTHSGIVNTLAKGGIFLVEAYTPRQFVFRTGGPSDPDFMVTAEILKRELFPLNPGYLKQLDRYLQEGSAHVGMSGVVQGIFIKAPL